MTELSLMVEILIEMTYHVLPDNIPYYVRDIVLVQRCPKLRAVLSCRTREIWFAIDSWRQSY